VTPTQGRRQIPADVIAIVKALGQIAEQLVTQRDMRADLTGVPADLRLAQTTRPERVGKGQVGGLDRRCAHVFPSPLPG
jgi:hypothetical protein